MAYADWSDEEYQEFHDDAFQEILDPMLEALTNEGLIFDQETLDAADAYFEQGFLNFEISEEERLAFREEFFNILNISPDIFAMLGGWDEFRELYDAING